MNKKIITMGILVMFLLTTLATVSALDIKTNLEKKTNVKEPHFIRCLPFPRMHKGIKDSVEIKNILQQGSLLGDPPETEWDKTFGGIDLDSGLSVQQTSDGGYIIAGKTYSYGSGLEDAWLIKIDENGNESWNKTFGGEGYDGAESVQQTTDGGYIITGFTNESDVAYGDVWLIKTDSSGNMEWDKTFGGYDWDVGTSVQQTSDGGYIIAGFTYSFGVGLANAWLIKTDSSGNLEWDKTFGKIGYYGGAQGERSVQQTSDGGYIMSGVICSLTGLPDVWLIKTDSNGNKLWDKTFGKIANYDQSWSVQQTTDGGYIITGFIAYIVTRHYDAWLIKTDNNGNKEWDKTFGESGEWNDEIGYSVQQTTDNGYIITGCTSSFEAGGYYDAWLMKTDSSGNMEWDKTFGGNKGDFGYSVQQTSDEGYIIIGTTCSFGVGDYDFWLIKVAPSPSENQRPNPPTVTGETNGEINVEYEYTFVANDPDGDDVCYYINWGDGKDEWTDDYYASGEEITVNHTWSKKGTYTIKAKAKDMHGAESDWETLRVTMPKNKQSTIHNRVFFQLLERLVNRYPLLEQVLNLQGVETANR